MKTNWTKHSEEARRYLNNYRILQRAKEDEMLRELTRIEKKIAKNIDCHKK